MVSEEDEATEASTKRESQESEKTGINTMRTKVE